MKKLTLALFIMIGVILAVVILLVVFLLPGKYRYPFCADHSPVECADNQTISCQSDSDCESAAMERRCSPGNVLLSKCADARYYCGADRTCQVCQCGR